MRKNVYSVVSLAFGLLVSGLTYAQTVKVDGEIRTRSEYRSGYSKPLADSVPSTLLSSLRTRINLSYSDAKIKAKISLQDTRNYGSTNLTGTGTENFGVLEAWGAYAFTPDFSMKLGRQILEYDDKRLLSGANWSNTGKAHDAMLLTYENKDLKAHVGTAYNNNSTDEYSATEYTGGAPYKYMSFVWLAKSIEKLNVSAIWVNDGGQKGTTNDLLSKLIIRNTLGGNVEFKDKECPVYAYATAYYQFGHDRSDNSLSAYLLAVKLKGNLTKTLSLTLGVDSYSGSKYDIESGKNNTFNKLYGTNHLLNGTIDYWSSLPTRGLLDLYGGLTFVPSKKFNIDATFHSFSLAQQYSATNAKKGLGSELDFTANYIVSPLFTIQGGWSRYFTNDLSNSIKKLSGDVKSNWAYVMVSFKPKFL